MSSFAEYLFFWFFPSHFFWFGDQKNTQPTNQRRNNNKHNLMKITDDFEKRPLGNIYHLVQRLFDLGEKNSGLIVELPRTLKKES